MTAVLVCEDADDMRAMLREGLGDDTALRVVGEAASGEDAIRQARTLQPDAVLLDIAMPGLEPSAMVTGVRRAAPSAAIVVLSGYGPERLGAGADAVDAYLPKTTDLATVRSTLLRAAQERGRAP